MSVDTQAKTAQEAAGRLLGAVGQAGMVARLYGNDHPVVPDVLPRNADPVPFPPYQSAGEQVCVLRKRLRGKVGEPGEVLAPVEENRATGWPQGHVRRIAEMRLHVAGHDGTEPDDT